MSTLAEIQAAAERLSARQQEELIRFLSARLPRDRVTSKQPYRTHAHPGHLHHGIDPDKLGQLPEEF